VRAFVFDNSNDNEKFIANQTDGIRSSVYYTSLQVGSISNPICTWVNYTIASSAYYYLALDEYTLGTLPYNADLYLHEIYLKFSDYEGSKQYCSFVSELQPCKFELHDILNHNKYILVTYIHFRSSGSPSTHICTKHNKPAAAVIVPATVGAVSLLLMIILLVVTVLYKCVKKRNMVESRGYTPVPNEVDDVV
jgi:hypothetical protein